MIKRGILVAGLVVILNYIVFAAQPITPQKITAAQTVYIGEVKQDDKFFIFDSKSYNLYNLLETTYIPLTYIESMGGNLIETESYRRIDFSERRRPIQLGNIYFKDTKAYTNNQVLYIGNLRTYSIQVEDQILVPIDALSILFEITKYQSIYFAENKLMDLNQYIKIDEAFITNKSQYMLRLNIMHIFWDGKKYVDKYTEEVLIEPYQKINKKTNDSEENLTYITSLILSINDINMKVNKENCYGQKNVKFLKHYYYEIRKEKLNKLFPSYRVMGTLKYDIGTYKKGQRVEVWRAEKRQYYAIKADNGKIIMMPWGSLVIEEDKGLFYVKVASEDIEDYVTIKGITSETDYVIWSDIYRQKVYILKGSPKEWKLQKVFRCSSGKNTHLTPTGIFKLEYTIPYFGLESNFRCKNAMVFFKDYMFHSILFDSTGKYVKAGKYQLGYRVSHGCVRLSEEDSAWLYKHIPLRTTVWIK